MLSLVKFILNFIQNLLKFVITKSINFNKNLIINLYRDQTNQKQAPPIVAALKEHCDHRWFSNDVLIAASKDDEKDINQASLDYVFQYTEGDAQTEMIEAKVQNYNKPKVTRSKKYNTKTKKNVDKITTKLKETVNKHKPTQESIEKIAQSVLSHKFY